MRNRATGRVPAYWNHFERVLVCSSVSCWVRKIIIVSLLKCFELKPALCPRWLRLALIPPVLILVCYGILMARVNAYASVSDPRSADAAIVLGAAVWGSRPSPVFAERIQHGIHLYHEGRVRALIFTGGLGQGDELTEAEAGRAFALARGVPAEDIWIETVSTVTAENVAQAARIVEEVGFSRVLMVSDPLHMKRSVILARDLGLDAYPSPTPTSRYRSWWSKSGFLVRETFWYAAYVAQRVVISI